MSLTVILSVIDVMTLSNTLRWFAVSLSVRSRMNTHTLRSMSKLHSMICKAQPQHGIAWHAAQHSAAGHTIYPSAQAYAYVVHPCMSHAMLISIHSLDAVYVESQLRVAWVCNACYHLVASMQVASGFNAAMKLPIHARAHMHVQGLTSVHAAHLCIILQWADVWWELHTLLAQPTGCTQHVAQTHMHAPAQHADKYTAALVRRCDNITSCVIVHGKALPLPASARLYGQQPGMQMKGCCRSR